MNTVYKQTFNDNCELKGMLVDISSITEYLQPISFGTFMNNYDVTTDQFKT